MRPFKWTKLSIALALAFRWEGARRWLFVETRPGSCDSNDLIRFVPDLKRDLRNQRVLLIWDGLSAHKSPEMTAYVTTQRR